MFKRKKATIPVMIGIFLVLGSFLFVNFFSMSASASNKPVNIGLRLTSQYPANWYEDSQMPVGAWFQDINNPIFVEGYQVSFMKVYSLGVTTRIMELSTYPRAYWIAQGPTYGTDTPFTVTQDDLNTNYNLQDATNGDYEIRADIEEGTQCFVDPMGQVWLLGETAVHYAWEPVPGNYPRWEPSETLPTPRWVDNKETVFPMVMQAIKGELVTVSIYEGYYKADITDATWTKLPADLLQAYVTAFTSTTDATVKVNKLVKNKDRTVVRFIYDQVISPSLSVKNKK